MASFEIGEVSSEGALSFFLRNSSGTAFHHPEVARILGNGCEWAMVSKGSEPFQIFPISTASDRDLSIPNFAYYFGPYWSDAFLRRPMSSRFGDSQKIYKLVLEYLASTNKSFEFELHHSETDVRPFLWWNYDNLAPLLDVVPRYSAHIENLQGKSKETLSAGFRSVRRQEIKKSEATGRFSFKSALDWQQLEHLYKSVLMRSAQVPEDSIARLDNLHALLETPFAECRSLVDNENGAIASATFTLRGKGVTHLVLALTADQYRGTGVGPLGIREAILRARDYGDSTFDFNGANSPLRGDDKHSYGATPALYFRISSTSAKRPKPEQLPSTPQKAPPQKPHRFGA